MDEKNFEVFRWYLLLIYFVFWWAKTFLKPLHTICYRFYAFSEWRKHFWRLQIVFAIHFKHFRIKENIFEAFAHYLISILSVFEWLRTLLKPSHSICHRILAFSDDWKHIWSLRILFAIDFRRFRIDENTFEGFRSYLLFIFSFKCVFDHSKKLIKFDGKTNAKASKLFSFIRNT